jgi:hypothetical protein
MQRKPTWTGKNMTSKTSELSAGVEILIARLASHPEEFFGPISESSPFEPVPSPKFGLWKAIIEDDIALARKSEAVRPATRHTWFLTEAEKAALSDAYRTASRLRFDSEVVAALYAKPEHVPMPSNRVRYSLQPQTIMADSTMRIDSNGGFGIGTTARSAFEKF